MTGEGALDGSESRGPRSIYFAHLVCDIVDYDDSIGPSVVARGDGPEPLLTSSVPLDTTRTCPQS